MGFEMEKTYLLVRIAKPINHNSKICGKFMPIKEWVKRKTYEEKDPVYTNPITLSQIYDKEDHLKVYSRNHKEFIETIKKYMEKENG